MFGTVRDTPQQQDRSTPTQHASERDRRTTERAAGMRDLTHTALARLADAMRGGHSAEYRAWAEFASRFYSYSARNQLLIRAQAPDAEYVAGYRQWQDRFGQQVRRGAHGIWIWAPALHKVKERQADGSEEVTERLAGFIPASVFSDKQLVDDPVHPLPKFWRPLPGDHEELFRTLVRGLEAAGRSVRLAPLRNGTQGFARGHLIVLRDDLDSTNRFFTLVHEAGHSFLHFSDPQLQRLPRAHKEWHAEATSFIVAQHFGIENPYSRDYELHYASDPEKLMGELDAIQHAVSAILGTYYAQLDREARERQPIERVEQPEHQETPDEAELDAAMTRRQHRRTRAHEADRHALEDVDLTIWPERRR